MPQPATHYLVTRFSIPKQYYNLWDKYKSYFGLGSSLPDLFYFPTVPIVADGSIVDALKNKIQYHDINWTEMADMIHADKSYDLFCRMLDYAKAIQSAEPENTDKYLKLFAVAFGFYNHVVADCIFHPYVYRSTGDFWNTTDFIDELQHKKQEAYIDGKIYECFYSGEDAYQRMKINCRENDTSALDFDVAEMLKTTLSEIYPDMRDSLSTDITDPEHPLHHAYMALENTTNFLFEERTTVCLWGQKKSEDISFSDLIGEFSDEFFTENYPDCENLPAQSPYKLFLLSVTVGYKVFNEAMNYINAPEISAKQYFSLHNTHYLRSGNFNLDTGLSALNNNDPDLTCGKECSYSFKEDTLSNNYRYFESDFKEHQSILESKGLLNLI